MKWWSPAILSILLLVASSANATITHVNDWAASQTGTTVGGFALNTSSGTQPIVGDVFIAILNTENSPPTQVLTPPAGWSTAIAQWTQTDIVSAVFYKVVTAGDIGATFTFNSAGTSVYWAGGISAFRGVNTNDPINVAGAGSGGTNSSNLTAASISIITPGSVLIYAGADDALSTYTLPNASYTALFNFAGGATNQGGFAGYLLNQAGTTGTVTGTSSNSTNHWQAVLFALTPANSVAGGARENWGLYPFTYRSATNVGSDVIVAQAGALASCQFYNNSGSAEYFAIYDSATVAKESGTNIICATKCAANAFCTCPTGTVYPGGGSLPPPSFPHGIWNGAIVAKNGLSWGNSAAFPGPTASPDPQGTGYCTYLIAQ